MQVVTEMTVRFVDVSIWNRERSYTFCSEEQGSRKTFHFLRLGERVVNRSGREAPKMLKILFIISWQVDIECQIFPQQLLETYKLHTACNPLVMLSS